MCKKEAEKRCVLRFDLKTCKVLDDVSSDGKLIRVLAVPTGKAHLPTASANSHW